VLPPAVERACQMFTADQFRAKAAEFRALLTNIARSSNETREFRDLEQTYTTLAENEEWMAVHIDKTIQRRKNYDNRTALAEEEEQILKCLGAAVLMRWNTVPTKFQRELFDCASAIGDLEFDSVTGTLKIQGMQAVAWVCQPTPLLPPLNDPSFGNS
jgi:hypothetical protein